MRINFDFHETLARSSLDYIHTYSCVAFVNIFSHRNLKTRWCLDAKTWRETLPCSFMRTGE